MYHYIALPPKVTIQTFEHFLRDLELADGVINVISFRDVEFIDPYGLVNLLMLLRHVAKIAHRVGLYLPRSPRVFNYLVRSRFLLLADRIAEILPSGRVYAVRSEISPDWLLELTPIVQEDDVAQVVEAVMSKIEGVLSKSLLLDNRSLVKFCGALSELCQNVPQHSQDWGVVAVQSYRKTDTGERFVRLALGDLGIGLGGSLAQKYPIAQWSEYQVMKAALTSGVSRLEDAGRGLGLAQVKATVNDLAGTLHLRSGTVRAFVRGTEEYYFPAPYFPGTQIAFELPGHKQVLS